MNNNLSITSEKDRADIIESINALIEALRNELQQYGEMLAILEKHQNNILDSNTSQILSDLSTITYQNEVIKNARIATERAKSSLCEKLNISANSTYQETVAHLPYEYQLLINALIEENNYLVSRIQNRVKQNHLLLKRSIEIIQQIIKEFVPGFSPSTYTSNGFISQGGLPISTFYSEIG